jgi:hypothetical protein
MDSSPAWNRPMMLAWRIGGGMLFQVMMVRGMNEKWYTSARLSFFDIRILITPLISSNSSFRLLTDFVCLYTYEFWLSLCKIARSSVILLLPLIKFLSWLKYRISTSIIIWIHRIKFMLEETSSLFFRWLRKVSFCIFNGTEMPWNHYVNDHYYTVLVDIQWS